MARPNPGRTGAVTRSTARGTCTVEIERSFDSLHAHAIPDDVVIAPGDVVLVHDAPTDTGGAPTLTRRCAITVFRAGPLARAWTRATAIFHLTSLYEVGFEANDAA